MFAITATWVREGRKSTTCDILKYWYVNDIGHPSHAQTRDSTSKHSNKAKKPEKDITNVSQTVQKTVQTVGANRVKIWREYGRE